MCTSVDEAEDKGSLLPIEEIIENVSESQPTDNIGHKLLQKEAKKSWKRAPISEPMNKVKRKKAIGK